jgi:hypothetical protein
MRHQPPDNNNPANPLLKVAALNIDKEIGQKDTSQARIVVNLTFKRSNDLRGKALSKDGRDVTVTFGLALARASFRLTLTTDRGLSANGLVKIEKVAFVNPIALKTHVADDFAITKKKAGNIELATRVEVHGNPINIVPSGNAKAKADASIGSGAKRKRRVSRKFETTNVSATFGGSEVHWEINPGAAGAADQSFSFLEGDVFRSAGTGRVLDACIISRKDGGSISSLVITGSVFVNMDNMIIENVSFLDEVGTPIDVRRIQQDNERGIGFREKIFRDEVKKRLLKQIIRKHLVSQGMTTDGALVEICRGNT